MILYTDGGCSANWQKDMSKRKMVSVVSDAAGLPIWEKHLQGGSNNIAEIVAVWGALKCCQRMGISTVEIRTDSQNNVAWCKSFRCSTKVNDALTVTNILSAIQTLTKTIAMNLVWIPREENLAGHYIEERHKL
jgi:ribonuclease HI